MPSIQLSTDSAPDPAGEEAPANIVETPTGVAVDVNADAPAEQTPADSRPEWLPEKFQSAEDMAKAYGELEKRMGAKAPAAEAEAPAAPDEATAAAAKAAGVDFDALTTEYAENEGALTDATLKDLEARGISRTAVDAYVRGQQALADQLTGSLAEQVGGKEQMDEILTWAQTGLSREQAEAYNAVVAAGNPEAVRMAFAGLAALHTQAHGKAPKLVQGATTSRTSEDAPFTANAQVIDAMRDPRYAKDPAYRAQVARRLGNTDTFGV
jgi:hypothetical protein